jgi:tetratricopeptide (TPR) repeat protein
MAKEKKKKGKSNVVEISTISGFLKVISEITKDSPTGFFIYRGQGNYDGVESGAYRRLKKSFDKLIEYQEQLINGARKRDDTHISIKNACDIIVLGEIQHFGGATSLIDFTYNSLTALYFACKSSKTPGKVYCLKTDDTSKFYKISQADSHNSGDKKDENDSKFAENLSFKDMINKLDSVDSKPTKSGSKKYLMWNPPFKNNRILKQDSVFIFNGEGKIDDYEFDKIIKIKKSNVIANSLEKLFNISEESLFPDFVGYVEANSFSKPYSSISADYYLDKAIEYHQKGEYDNAIRFYGEAIELQPDYEKAYNNRGNAYSDLKQYDKAISDYNKAIEFKPNYAVAYFNRGITYDDLKKFNEAIADYTKAIEFKPDYAEAYNNRGAVYSDLQKYNEAIADYTKAIEFKPDYANAYNNRGNVYDDLQKYDEAIKDWEKAIELNSEDKNILQKWINKAKKKTKKK